MFRVFIGPARVNGSRLAIWAPRLAPSAGVRGTRGLFFLIFCLNFFCELIPHYLKLLAQIWGYFEFFWYISLIF
jgi:hypothetical protein